MKRAWLGIGILAAILAAALTVTWTMERLHVPIAEDLEQAAEATLSGDMDRGLFLADRAEAQWFRWERLRGCFSDHGPSEEADGMFAALRVYGAMEEERDFAAACAELARKVRAMSEAHALNWRNLF